MLVDEEDWGVLLWRNLKRICCDWIRGFLFRVVAVRVSFFGWLFQMLMLWNWGLLMRILGGSASVSSVDDSIWGLWMMVLEGFAGFLMVTWRMRFCDFERRVLV